jgi:gamma-glutamyltranspeptidase / glutathione hydrolase
MNAAHGLTNDQQGGGALIPPRFLIEKSREALHDLQGVRRPVSSRWPVSLVTPVLLALLLSSMPAMGQSSHPFGKPTVDNRNPTESLAAVTATRPSGTWADQTRSEAVGRRGMVATSQPLASEAGLDILKQGGNAIDAAVAAAAVLTITEPGSHSLGGDTWAILWSAKHKKLFALNSSGWSPAAWTLDYFQGKGYDEVPGDGPDAITVPGAVSGWDALLKRFGTMTFEETFERAATLAEEGFPVTERTARDIDGSADDFDEDLAQTWLVDGEAPLMYSILRVPDYAHAYRVLQEQGRDAFYKGEIAEAIVTKIQSIGGVMTMQDLAAFESEWVEPLTTNYHGYDIHQLPPNNQGFAALEMLNILEVCIPQLGFDLAELGPRDPQYWHLLVEAKKLAYSDLHRYNADPRFEPPPLDTLLDKEYAASLCDKIDPDQARPADVLGNVEGDTVYFATADRWGNMVSFVSSIFSGFGAKVGVPGYGFPLQNRGSGFVLEEGHPNVVEPRKRPFHTIMTGFITKDGEPLMAFGNMGGGTQPQAHVQHIVNMIDLGINVQATTDVARFDHDQLDDELTLDRNLFDLVGPELEAMGHTVDRGQAVGGGYQGILFERDPSLPEPPVPPGNDEPINGIYRAGSDHRKDGLAIGW